MAARTKSVLEQFGMNKFAAVGASQVIFFAAIPADVNPLAIRGCRGNNFVSRKIFFALVAKHEVVFEATGTNVGAVARFDNLFDWVIFFAVFAKAIVIVETMFADVNALAVAVDDFSRFGVILVAFLTVFIFVRVARIAVQSA